MTCNHSRDEHPRCACFGSCFGEQGESPETLHAEQYGAGYEFADLIAEQRRQPAGRLIPRSMLARLAELATDYRTSGSAASLAEMLDLATELGQ